MTEADAARSRFVLDVFEAALDQPAAERAGWLIRHHGDDTGLVARVTALLAADSLTTGAFDRAGSVPAVPARIGVYRLVEPIGRGGMGQVWRGERDDGLFEQAVAIKVMNMALPAAEAGDFFVAERKALARLRHPNIARLLDGGVTAGGLPWFVMELVDGVGLDVYRRRHPPAGRDDLRALVSLAAKLCDAVQHAHQNLIVHADIKPANILVEPDGEPRLVDFGIARSVRAAEIGTEQPAFPRTPAYSSPERMNGTPPSVADDVFALGTVIDGLLTGDWSVIPDDARSPPSTRVAATVSKRALHGDLDAIVARARAGDAGGRYATAEALAADLRAWLDRRPVAARGGTWRYVAWRFVQRNRWASLASTVALVALLAGSVTVAALYVRSERARREAEQRFDDVRALARYMLADLHDALEPIPGGSVLRARTARLGLGYLRNLASLPRADLDLRKELGVGYGRVGRALAVNATNGVSETDAGERALIEAERTLRPLADRHPERADLQVELARVLTWRSSIEAWTRSRPDAALAMLAEADRREARVLARRPADVEATYARLLTVLGRTDVLGLQQRWTERVALTQANIPIARAAPRDGRHPTLRSLIEAALESALGDSLSYLGRSGDALGHYRRAIEILDRARTEQAPDVRVLTRLVGYEYQLSTGYQEIGDRPKALQAAETGQRLAAELLRIDTSPTALSMANLVGLQHATLLVEIGHAREAVAEARYNVEMRRRHALADPTSDDARSSYLFALWPLVGILDMAGRPQAACAAARDAKAGWQRLYAGRKPPERQAGDMAHVDKRLAACAPSAGG